MPERVAIKRTEITGQAVHKITASGDWIITLDNGSILYLTDSEFEQVFDIMPESHKRERHVVSGVHRGYKEVVLATAMKANQLGLSGKKVATVDVLQEHHPYTGGRDIVLETQAVEQDKPGKILRVPPDDIVRRPVSRITLKDLALPSLMTLRWHLVGDFLHRKDETTYMPQSIYLVGLETDDGWVWDKDNGWSRT